MEMQARIAQASPECDLGGVCRKYASAAMLENRNAPKQTPYRIAPATPRYSGSSHAATVTAINEAIMAMIKRSDSNAVSKP